MSTYAVFDAEGFPTGFYPSELFGSRMRPVFGDLVTIEVSVEDGAEPVRVTDLSVSPNPPIIGEEPNPDCLVPAHAVEITDEQHSDFIKNQGLRRWLDGEVIVYEPPGPSPEEIAAAARLAEFPNLYPDQFWFGLRAAGYEDDVRAWVAQLNDPGTEDAPNPDYDPVAWAWASAKLEFASFFERDHALVQAAQQAIGISEAELDALWKFAASGPGTTAG